MCKAIDDMRKHSEEKGIQTGIKQGEILATLKIYHNMIDKGMSEAEARELSGVTDEMLENEKKAE